MAGVVGVCFMCVFFWLKLTVLKNDFCLFSRHVESMQAQCSNSLVAFAFQIELMSGELEADQFSSETEKSFFSPLNFISGDSGKMKPILQNCNRKCFRSMFTGRTIC